MVAAPVTTAPALELVGAAHRFDTGAGLRPVTLRVDRATTCLVQGPNGSGKTTLLRLCAGLLRPSSGSCRLSGRGLYLRPSSGGRRRQTVHQALETVRVLAERPAEVVDDALELARLTAFTGRRLDTLSSGQRTRLVIGVALCAAPTVLCLDEPAAHLDRDGRDVLRAGVERLVLGGSAVLVATHDRALLEQPPDALLVVEDGQVRADR